MAENIPLRVQFKRMTAEEWARSDVILLDGEIGFETDTGFAKFGNGKNQFKDLKYLQGPRGDKGDSITISEQQKTADGLQLTFSDKTQVTIPKGDKGDSVKGDKGNSVTSARVDESGNFYVTIEGQSEKLLGNIKGGKGDPLKFEELTPDQIAQIKAKDVDLSSYVTKTELAKIDVSKQLTDYLLKNEAEQTYLKKTDKVELPTDLVKTGDIADVVRKQELTSYATKDDLKNKVDTLTITKLQATIESKLDKATADAAYLTKDGVSGIAVAKVITDASQATDSNILYLIKG